MQPDIAETTHKTRINFKNFIESSILFSFIILFHRISVNCSTTMGSDVNTSVLFRITGYMQDQSPLVLIVIDPDPGFGLIRRTKNSANSIHGSNQVDCRIIRFWRCFAKTKGMDFLNAIEFCEKFSRVSRMIKPVECGYPEVALVFR